MQEMALMQIYSYNVAQRMANDLSIWRLLRMRAS